MRQAVFAHDPLGRRIYKSSSSGTSIFAYDGDDLIEEMQPLLHANQNWQIT